MKKLKNVHMDFKSISYLMMVIPSLASIVYSNTLTSDLDEYYSAYSTLNYNNYTRGKRQLFREDIPHHRPLSGNVYAHEHGFPHPGRWTDGLKNQYKVKPQFPSHQQYLDMIDNNQHGHYRRPKVPRLHSVSFGSDMFHGTGGSGNYGPPYKPLFGFDRPGHSQSNGVDYDGPKPDYGPGPITAPVYGPPKQQGHKGPKTVVHYHPVQYGNVLNFPESGNNNNYNPSPIYGPPNHSSGVPIGPTIQSGGFRPSTFLDNHGGHGGGHHHDQNNYGDHHNNHKDSHYRFEPFKIFSHPSPPPKSLDHDIPIPIPILAQFHSAKPIKFSKIKQPLQVVFGHHPRQRPGPHHQYQFPQHHYSSRPFKHWLHQFTI